MAKLVWDKISERLYETGVSNCALYVSDGEGGYGKGVAWNGITAITESPSGAEPTALYADNIKYLNLMSNEELGATIEAYMYPDEFNACNGLGTLDDKGGVTIGQQSRKTFALVYKTIIGNDTDNNDYGYKIHIIYGALAAPSEKAYSTTNDSPEAITFSWELTTSPVEVPGFKPTSSITIDSTKVDAEALATLEGKLYGTETEEPTLMLPAEIVELVGTKAAG